MNKTMYLKCLLFTVAMAAPSLQAENTLIAAENPCYPFENACHPLIQAAIDGDVKALTALINDGSNINVTDEEGTTALMHAAANAYVDCVNVLLDANSDIKSTDVYGKTPLQYALLGKAFTYMAPGNKAVKRVILADYETCIATLAAHYEVDAIDQNS